MLKIILALGGTGFIGYCLWRNLFTKIRFEFWLWKKEGLEYFFVSSRGPVYGECAMPANENSRLFLGCEYAAQ